MANNPVMGVAQCPYCNRNNPLIWDGNRRIKCYNCMKPFTVHRQKLKDVKPIYGVKRSGTI